MTAYIVDTHAHIIQNTYKDASFASYAMSDNYGWEPDNQYLMFHNEDALYEWWELCFSEDLRNHEGLGISENMKHDMFKDFLEN